MTTTFRNIPLTRADILAALRDFDSQYPTTNDYDNWLDKDTYKYALIHNDKRYPPKYILSAVTGIPTTEFTGGQETNRVFHALKFDIENK